MPSLKDSIGVDLSSAGYRRVEPEQSTSRSVPALDDFAPRMNPWLRCPMPPINTNPDSQRQFYRGGSVGQMRALTPPPPMPLGGTVTVTQNITAVTQAASAATGAAQPTANTAAIETEPLDPGTNFQGTVLLSKTFTLLKVAVSVAARVRLYSSRDFQVSDVARGQTAPAATTQHGVICDLWMDTVDKFNWILSPAAVGCNADEPQSRAIYVTVDNIGESTNPILVSLLYVGEES